MLYFKNFQTRSFLVVFYVSFIILFSITNQGCNQTNNSSSISTFDSDEEEYTSLTVKVATDDFTRQLQRVQYSDIGDMELIVKYSTGEIFASNIFLEKVDSVWQTTIENIPVNEYAFIFQVDVYNTSSTKIMSGTVSQKVLASGVSIDIPIEVVESENEIVLMPVIEEINSSLPMVDGSIEVKFKIYNPAGDNLSYEITKDISSSGNFVDSNGNVALSSELGNTIETILELILSDEVFESEQTYTHSIVITNSYGDTFKKFFSIASTATSDLENTTVTVSFAPVVESLDISQNEDNLTFTAIIDEDLKNSITGFEWSLENESYSFMDNSINGATITNFNGIIDDTILLTLTSENALTETFSYKIQMGIIEEEETINYNLPKVTEYSKYGEIYFSDYKIINNIWGTDILNQNIYVSNDDGTYTFPAGWEWNWTMSNSSILSYPAIAYGQRPWDSTSTTPNLPVMVSNIKTLDVDYKVDIQSSKRHNLAFDIWLVSSLSGDLASNRTHEIMIWTDRQQIGGDFVPIGYPNITGTFTSNGITYDIYEGMNGNFKVISFLRQNADDTDLGRDETIKVQEFVQYLLNSSKISGSLYLIDLEFGTEIMEGTGSAVFSNFDVTFSTY